jgi:hypothetical protein
MRRSSPARIVAPSIAVLALLAGCSAGAPTPSPTGSEAPVDRSEQADIAGEWLLTRTVVSSEDANNPARAVGAVSTRSVLFGDIVCADGPCKGGVLSGPGATIRDSTTFESAGDVITYEFTGHLNCIRQDTGAVLVANGYAYTATVTLEVVSTDAADDSRASTLSGTMTYTDTVSNEALEAGCSREPVEAATEYSLTAVRTAIAPAPAATPAA